MVFISIVLQHRINGRHIANDRHSADLYKLRRHQFDIVNGGNGNFDEHLTKKIAPNWFVLRLLTMTSFSLLHATTRGVFAVFLWRVRRASADYP